MRIVVEPAKQSYLSSKFTGRHSHNLCFLTQVHHRKVNLSAGGSPGGNRRATTSIGNDFPYPVGTAPIRCCISSWFVAAQMMSALILRGVIQTYSGIILCSFFLKHAPWTWKSRNTGGRAGWSTLRRAYFSLTELLLLRSSILLVSDLKLAEFCQWPDHPQNIFLFIGEWEEELINTHTRALPFNFSLVPPSYSASSLVKRAGLVWCSKDLPYLKVAEILPVLTLWFDQYVLMEGERGWGSYFSVHIILCISLILDQDEHFDDRQCVHFKWTWTGICDKNVSNMQTHKSQPT